MERCADDETSARGAALCAAQSQGWQDAGERASPMLAPCDTVEPDPSAARAEAEFMAGFNELIDRSTATAAARHTHP